MAIVLDKITYKYMAETPYEKIALHNVSLTVEDEKFLAIAGHTGSGKSTLMQHLNGLIVPASGTVTVDGVNINVGKTQEVLKAKRSIGMVFQYPEQQLFEETIYRDIAFGPRNFGLSEEEIKLRVQEAMDFVELDYNKYKDKSPFSLSGGQMRRVAMAGIIALKPKYLVLDEPTAGLDPGMKATLLKKVYELYEKEKTTIIMVSHNMDDIAEMADRVVIMNHGELMLEDTPRKVFEQQKIIAEAGLLPPEVMQLMSTLKKAGLPFEQLPIRRNGALEAIFEMLAGRDKLC